MKKITFAQKAIQKRAQEKAKTDAVFQDYSEHNGINAWSEYSEWHGDYSDFSN